MVVRAICGFRAGSPGGLNHLQPQHLKEVIAKSLGRLGFTSLSPLFSSCYLESSIQLFIHSFLELV